jgi:hypothetical protein
MSDPQTKPAQGAAKSSKSKAKAKAKDKAKAKAKAKDKGGAGAGGDDLGLSVATHPHARRSVREIKAWTGLAAFAAALVLSLGAGVPMAMAVERALMAGMAGYLVAWGCALAVWRALLAAQLHARIEEIKAARERASVPVSK